MNKELHLLTAKEIAKQVNSKEISALEVAKYFIQRAQELNPKINAFNCITEELALKQAEHIDAQISKGETFKLAGVPIAIKDNLCVRGTKTTCSSKMLQDFVAPYEATVTNKLWEEGAICLGKTNLDEFAMGSSTEHSAFETTKNPWDVTTVPGGSSGGSAAAVSARLAPLALGSDTGGSIRQPAALCGVVGMKPTYGLVSRYGLVAFASSLDQVGPFATNVEDASLLLEIISGHDNKDSTSLKASYASTNLNTGIKGLKLGIIKELIPNTEKNSPAIVKAFENSIATLKFLGAEVTEVSMPTTVESSLDVYYIVAPAEASSNLSRYDGVRYGYRDPSAKGLKSMYKKSRSHGFGDEVKRRIMIGTYALSSGYYDAYYKKAQQVRHKILNEFKAVFKDVDMLISPTSPVTAFKFGEKTNDPLSMYLCDIATIPANLAGIPAISVNCGFDDKNLPIGLQFMAGHLDDEKLFLVAQAFESSNKELQEKLPTVV